MSKEQIVLGINGYSRRLHDASACITVDGNLIAMAEEERFTRRKNSFGQLPHHSIAFCLEKTGVPIDDIDIVAVGWDFDKIFGNIGQNAPSKDELLELYLPTDRFNYSKKPTLEMIPHHIAHASSSYYLSGYKEATTLVMDGQGETQSTSVFRGEGDELKFVEEFGVKDSLGYFYEAVSEYVGLSRLDAGKTMGLAAYGSPEQRIELIKLTNDGYMVDIVQPQQTEMDLNVEITSLWRKYLEDKFGPRNNEVVLFDNRRGRFQRQTDFSKHYKDIAASAQKTLEHVVRYIVGLKLADRPKNLCIAGGVGLNCSLNGVLLREGVVESLFVPPFTNDAGVSVGAALYVSDKKPNQPLKSSSLGPEFSNEAIISTLNSLGIDYEMVDGISKKVAELVAQGKIVDWFQGRMEAGPRALGNRSILGNPTDPETHSRLNSVKNREQWRPLAPSFLAGKLAEYMIDPSESPFMLRAFKVKPEMARYIPAAVHIDGTSRAQTVTPDDNPLYHELIKNFEQISGVPAIMNTSFNLDFEPIVCTPEDAVRTFYSSGADQLAIGNVLIKKKG